MSVSVFPRRFGKYILLDRLNTGGMAEVYRAKTSGTDGFQRMLAIKCMLPQLAVDAEFATMFIDEAKLASQLAHSNIVQIHELGRIEGRLYIAMELVHGRDLRHILKQAARLRRPLGFQLAAYVIHKAAEALDYAHRKHSDDGHPLNLVHRDVSPQNVLISYEGEVKVVDFGIAKAEDRATKTRAGTLKGKFAYMSPEQVAGGAVDGRTDLFALGAVLYEIVVGKKMFGGEADFSVLQKVRNARVPEELSRQLRQCPPELEAVIRKAVARLPADRYQRGSDLADAVAPFLISNRTIYGPKQAAEVMRELYSEEIAAQAELMRRFSAVALADPSSASPAPNAADWSMDTRALAPVAVEPSRPSRVSAVRAARMDRSSSEPTQMMGSASAARALANVRPTSAARESGTTPKRRVTERAAAVVVKNKMGLIIAAIALQAGFVVAAIIGLRAESASRAPAKGNAVARQESVPASSSPTAGGEVPSAGAQAAAAAAAVAETETETETARTEPENGAPDKVGERYGYVSIIAEGAKNARVYVDGKDMGFAPVVAARVRIGKRMIRVVEQLEGRRGKARSREVTVKLKNTRKAPLELVVRL